MGLPCHVSGLVLQPNKGCRAFHMPLSGKQNLEMGCANLGWRPQ